MTREDIIKATRNSLNIYSFTAEALEKLIVAIQSEHQCQTCEALARTVMMDQTAHDTQTASQREWVGLLDEPVVSAAARVLSDRVAASCNVDCRDMWMLHGNDSIEDARAMLEAAEAKLKEKNT